MLAGRRQWQLAIVARYRRNGGGCANRLARCEKLAVGRRLCAVQPVVAAVAHGKPVAKYLNRPY
jgi:hypothetical protein